MSWLSLRSIDVSGLSATLVVALAVTGCDSDKNTKNGGTPTNELPDAAVPAEEPDAAVPEEEPDAAAPEPEECAAPSEMCGETCVDTQTDVAHCGECDVACLEDQLCEAGTCVGGVQFAGIQKNLPIAALVGWTQCFVGLYGDNLPLTDVLTPCSGSNLLLGCRLKDADTLLLAAHAPRADALFDVGYTNDTHEANGVGWYFSDDASWGFAPAGAPVERDSCDTVAQDGLAEEDGAERLCWHTEGQALSGGYRCGDVIDLNDDDTYERVIFHAP